ncbi:hypothetical protein GTO10_02535 [Candidatus Saccharibacteria bacterium]|nr:hypothetical protein [Candidatus Saccharibacteria bacterium]
MNERIVLPTGLAGWKARRLLRRHISKLSKISDGSTDPERTLCEQLLREGRVELSSLGEAKDTRMAFFALRKMLSQ